MESVGQFMEHDQVFSDPPMAACRTFLCLSTSTPSRCGA